MKKRILLFLICLSITASFSGCMARRALPPDQRAGQGNPGSQISASYGMADMYNVTLKSNSKVKAGTDGNSPDVYTLPNGTTVRVLGKIDNKYYVIMPSNNRVGVIPIANATPTPAAPAEPVPSVPNAPTGGGTNEEGTMLNLINAARTAQGLKPLASDEQLVKIARLKSQDLVKNNYFSHVSPTYGSPFDMIKKYGVSYLYAGENLAKNTNAGAAHTALMNSPGHKANILNTNFTNVGIGIATNKDGTKIYTQMFIGR